MYENIFFTWHRNGNAKLKWWLKNNITAGTGHITAEIVAINKQQKIILV